MGLADFGGSIDYSGLFSSLQDQFDRRVEQMTARARNRSEEEQAANDADMYDQWKNGKISDDEWLAYIQKRVDETAGDPKEHEEWVKTLRDHTTAIADAQMETAFESGATSINQLIAYYKGRMNAVEEESPAWRELVARYDQLVDKRDTDNVYWGADKILTGIARGTNSYGDLKAFYQKQLQSLRPGSTVAEQIRKQISEIDQRIAGGGSGGGSRSGGGVWPRGFKPGTGTAGVPAGSGDNVITPVNELRAADGIDGYIDGLFGDLDRIDTMLDQLDADPSRKSVTDPLTGEVVSVDAVHDLFSQYLATEDMVAAAKWADGDVDGATEALKQRGNFIAKHVQVYNSSKAKPVWDQVMGGFISGVIAGSQIADPGARAAYYSSLVPDVQKVADSITGVTRKRTRALETPDSAPGVVVHKRDLPEEMKVDPKLMQDVELSMSMVRAIGDPSLSPDQRIALLSEVIDSRPEGYRLTAEQIQQFADGDPSNGTIGGIETYVQMDGLAQGTMSYYYDGQVTRVVDNDALAEVASPDPETGRPGAVMTYQKVNGNLQRVWSQTQPVDSDFFVYQYGSAAPEDQKGKFVPTSEVSALSITKLNELMRNGVIQAVSYAPAWTSMVTPDGSSWFQDPETHLWYKGRMPVKMPRDASGGLLVGDDGKVQMEYLPFASAGGVLAPFSGVDAKTVQFAMMADVQAGVIDLNEYAHRDQTGEAQRGAPVIDGMYWDPSSQSGYDDGREFNRAAQARSKDAFHERQQERIERQAEAFVKQNMTSRERARWRGMGQDPTDFYADRISKFGEKLGLKLAGRDRPAQAPMPVAFQPDAATAARARGSASSPVSALPKIAPKPARVGGFQETALPALPPQNNAPKLASSLPSLPKPAPGATSKPRTSTPALRPVAKPTDYRIKHGFQEVM